MQAGAIDQCCDQADFGAGVGAVPVARAEIATRDRLHGLGQAQQRQEREDHHPRDDAVGRDGVLVTRGVDPLQRRHDRGGSERGAQEIQAPRGAERQDRRPGGGQTMVQQGGRAQGGLATQAKSQDDRERGGLGQDGAVNRPGDTEAEGTDHEIGKADIGDRGQQAHPGHEIDPAFIA